VALLSLRGVSLAYGAAPVLDGVDLTLEGGERICLVGRNGTGKSTLLRIVAGDISPDGGEVVRQTPIGVALLEQVVPRGLAGSVFDVVAEGLGKTGTLLARYHEINALLAEQGGDALLAELARVQHELEAAGGWHLRPRVEAVLSRVGLDPDARVATLSGGLTRRLLLARALVGEPDLLLLDEPTNHLDIETIAWLEELLLGFAGTLLFVTHDRVFLERLATRIVELDRGRLTDWPGDYQAYLRAKQTARETEVAQQALFDKRLAEEEAWIRQGIKARRTRNEGRVRALEQMRALRRGRREASGQARFRLQEAERSGKLVVEAQRISYGYGAGHLFQDLSTTILRGDRVGIIGPNGCGKTTVLQILLGQREPQNGTMRFGTRIEVAYYDQHRAQLETEKTVRDNVNEGSDQVCVDGRSRHVLSYLQDFLFSPQRAQSPVKVLSGGERNRLLLARLFSRPSNLLVLDEPTNDLDIDTLELLEERLLEYGGTVLLVSHDRAFLNNIVTSTLVFEGMGGVREYVGGYDDWLRQRAPATGKQAAPTPKRQPAAPSQRERSPKLSYKEQRELESLPQRIEELEGELEGVQHMLADPRFYQRGGEEIAAARSRVQELERLLAETYSRWEALETAKG
jgi:ATP-binding cassette subfamily F protein uup